MPPVLSGARVLAGPRTPGAGPGSVALARFNVIALSTQAAWLASHLFFPPPEQAFGKVGESGFQPA